MNVPDVVATAQPQYLEPGKTHWDFSFGLSGGGYNPHPIHGISL